MGNDPHDPSYDWPADYRQLREALAILRACADPKCSLCARCLAALSPIGVMAPPPDIAENDPVRTHRKRFKWKRDP